LPARREDGIASGRRSINIGKKSPKGGTVRHPPRRTRAAAGGSTSRVERFRREGTREESARRRARANSES